MASNTSKRPTDEAPAAPTPTQKRVKADPPVNSPRGALPRHNPAIHSPAGLPTRPSGAREQVLWLKDTPPSHTPIKPHPMAIKLFSEVKVCRFQPDS